MTRILFLTYLIIFLISNSFANVLITENEKNTVQIFGDAVHSVVNVSNIQIARNFWSYGEIEVPAGAGTGFVWDSEGHIVTNYHVVEGGDSFMISFHKDPKQYKAKIVGVEPKLDVAVLKLIDRPLKTLAVKTGTSGQLLVGQKTLAIGNPFGLDHTITEGIVSALERKIDGIGGVKIHGMIQTDASINPGNSGGPLLNSKGEVIGMNTIIISRSGSSAGVGFAVPIDSIKRVVPQLIKFGKVTRPGLGIGIAPEQLSSRFGLKDGVLITVVDKNGPAALAGLRGMKQDDWGRIYIGDIILEIDHKKINSLDDIYHLLENYKVGDTISITYLRNDKKLTTKLTLAKMAQ